MGFFKEKVYTSNLQTVDALKQGRSQRVAQGPPSPPIEMLF